MEKRTLAALAALVGLGLLAFVVTRAPEKGQRQGPPPRPVAALKAAEVTKLEVTSEKQERTVLEKVGDEWRVKEPGDHKADPGSVKALVESLERMSFGDVVSENQDKQAELGVAEGKSARVVASGKAGPLADLHVGRSIGGFTMVRPAGKGQVWQATGLTSSAVDHDPKAWRDHTIFALTAADVERFAVEAGTDKLVVERLPATPPAEPRWKLIIGRGAAPKSEADLDQALVNAAVQSLSTLHASDFADGDKPEALAAASDKLTLALTAKGKTSTLTIGAARGEDVAVAADGDPAVYLVKKLALEAIAHRPADYRDKTICKLKEGELKSVAITDGGQTTVLQQTGNGNWKAAKGAVDDTKVKPVVAAFENLQASGLSPERDPKKTGLVKPQAQAILETKGRAKTILKVGAATADDYYLQKVGSPEVYLVKKFAVDQWKKKPSELAK